MCDVRRIADHPRYQRRQHPAKRSVLFRRVRLRAGQACPYCVAPMRAGDMAWQSLAGERAEYCSPDCLIHADRERQS